MPNETNIEMPQPLGLFATDLFVRGEEYLLAFERLTQDGKTEFPHAGFSLLAHALELFLKSYLAAHGISKGKLKIRYSHDLLRPSASAGYWQCLRSNASTCWSSACTR